MLTVFQFKVRWRSNKSTDAVLHTPSSAGQWMNLRCSVLWMVAIGGFPTGCAQKQGHLLSCLHSTQRGPQRPASSVGRRERGASRLDNSAAALVPVQEKREHYRGSDPETSWVQRDISINLPIIKASSARGGVQACKITNLVWTNAPLLLHRLLPWWGQIEKVLFLRLCFSGHFTTQWNRFICR